MARPLAMHAALRRRLHALALALALLPFAATAEVRDLQVGGLAITVPLEDDEVSIADVAPAVFDVFKAGMPTQGRLVAAFLTQDDFGRMQLGESQQDIYVMVMALRAIEHTTYSAGQWKVMQPGVASGMLGLDLEKAMAQESAGSAERMSEAMGMETEVEFGELETPVIFRTDEYGLYYTMRVPVKVTVQAPDGAMVEDTVSLGAGAVVLVRGKVLMINCYSDARDFDANDGKAPAQLLREKLEVLIEQVIALNQGDAPEPDAPETPRPSKTIPGKTPTLRT